MLWGGKENDIYTNKADSVGVHGVELEEVEPRPKAAGSENGSTEGRTA
jgi:hypothetical protein